MFGMVGALYRSIECRSARSDRVCLVGHYLYLEIVRARLALVMYVFPGDEEITQDCQFPGDKIVWRYLISLVFI